MSFLEYSLKHELTAPKHSLELESGARFEFLETGVLRVRPSEEASYRVIISCGIHGNETAPMELVDQLFKEIRANELQVNNEILFIIGNPPAANKAKRFIEENLNRLFSGNHKSSHSQEAKRAELLEKSSAAFFGEGEELRLHYDLHTAIRESEFEKFAVYPFLHERVWSQQQIAFLENCGVGAVLLSSQPAGTFSYFTSNNFHSHAFTVELGKVEKFGDNDMEKFADVLQGLRNVISGDENFVAMPQQIKVFKVVEEVIKRSENLKLHFADDAKNFSAFHCFVQER